MTTRSSRECKRPRGSGSNSKTSIGVRYTVFATIVVLLTLAGCNLVSIISPYSFGQRNGGYGSEDPGSDEPYKYLEQSNTENHEVGTIESIIEYGEDWVIGVHYPVTGKDRIDAATKELINEAISEFITEVHDFKTGHSDLKAELNIDYETWLAKDRLVSMKFIIFTNMPNYAHPDVTIKTAVYDLESQKPVLLRDILTARSLDRIADLAREDLRSNPDYGDYLDEDLFIDGTEPVDENYSNFVLTTEHLIILFQKYQLFPGAAGQPTAAISYEKLEGIVNFSQFSLTDSGNSSNPSDSSPKSDLHGPSHEEEYTDGIQEPIVKITRPVREIDPEKPMVALTFDDGPCAKNTGSILDTLAANDAVATFFVLGNRVSDNETLLARMMKEGSEIGNHSFNHKQLTTLSSDELQQQIKKTQAAINKATGHEPVIMRPTYGSYNEELRESAGMAMILWSVDTRDWETRDAAYVSKKVLESVQDGDIVLMHDIYVSTADAVKIIVPELKGRGYQLVTVSELHEAKGVALEAGKVYRREAKK